MTGFVPMFGNTIIDKKKAFKGNSKTQNNKVEDKYKKRRLELLEKKKQEKLEKENK